MRQTMLAMLALLILTMISVNQRRSIVHNRQQIMRNELATVAAGKLTERLDLLGGLPFEELDDLPATEEVSVEAMGTTLEFEIHTEVEPVEVDSSGQVVSTGSGENFRRVTLRIRGPVDGSGPVALPRDASGKGTITMQRVYNRLGNE
jgi:hypothetical protein